MSQWAWGRPLTKAEIKAREVKARKRKIIYDKAVAAKERRRAIVLARRKRENELPDRMLAAMDEADRLLVELQWQ